jgi:hypothetical protein
VPLHKCLLCLVVLLRSWQPSMLLDQIIDRRAVGEAILLVFHSLSKNFSDELTHLGGFTNSAPPLYER